MPSASTTLDLFGDDALPDGFRYQSDFLSSEEEQSLLQQIVPLPFREFEFQGFTGKRRIVSFGWRYDFNGGGLIKAVDMPEFLLAIRARAETFAAIPEGAFQQVLISEYTPGSAIGWHKDRSVFGDVVGISLLSACKFRLRRKTGNRCERRNLTAEPGRFTCCAVLPGLSGSTAFRVWTASATQSPSEMFLKGRRIELAAHRPHRSIAEFATATGTTEPAHHSKISQHSLVRGLLMSKYFTSAAVLLMLSATASAAPMKCTSENMAKTNTMMQTMADGPNKMAMGKDMGMANMEMSKGNMKGACKHYMNAQKTGEMKAPAGMKM